MSSLYSKLINYKEAEKLSEEIEGLSDEKEKEKRQALMDKIVSDVFALDWHIQEYEYKTHWRELVKSGKIKVSKQDKASISAKWVRIFAKDVSKETRSEIFFNQYRWHIFSYKKVKALEKSRARAAFNKANKDNLYVFYQNKDDAYLYENANAICALDFGFSFFAE